MLQSDQITILQASEITARDLHESIHLLESVEPGWSEVYLNGLLNIFKEFKEPFIMAKYEDEPIGLFVVLPIDTDYISEWCEGKHDHEFLYLDFPEGKVIHPKPDSLVHALIELIAIKPGLDTFTVLPKMVEKFASYIQSLANQSCFIEKVYSEAFSKQGHRLASFFGLHKIRDTEFGTLYGSGTTPDKFIRLFPSEFESLNKVYRQKFQVPKFKLK